MKKSKKQRDIEISGANSIMLELKEGHKVIYADSIIFLSTLEDNEALYSYYQLTYWGMENEIAVLQYTEYKNGELEYKILY